MSHYSKIQTEIVDQESLLKALAGLGYRNVEVHDYPVNLFGYRGDMRAEKANVVIRRRFVGDASNDVGFVKNADGIFQAVISEWDQQLLGADWVQKVCQAYAYQAVVAKLEEQGYSIATQEVDPATKKIRLVLKR